MWTTRGESIWFKDDPWKTSCSTIFGFKDTKLISIENIQKKLWKWLIFLGEDKEENNVLPSVFFKNYQLKILKTSHESFLVGVRKGA